MNFDDYIQELLGNRNPQGNMFTGLSSMPPSSNTLQANNSNPFSIQNAIDARNASNVVTAPPVAAITSPVSTPATTGMLGGDGGYGGNAPMGNTSPNTDGYFDIDQLNNFLSIVNSFTGKVPTPLSLALSAYTAFQDPNSVFNNPHSLFDQFTNPALDPHEDDNDTPQYGEIPSMQAAVNAQANAMPVDPGVQATVNANQAAVNAQASAMPVDPGVQATINANQAVISPVNMAFSPTTPIGMLAAPPMAVDPSIQATINAQAQAVAQAQAGQQAAAQAAAVQAALAASMGEGMLGGTQGSDAAVAGFDLGATDLGSSLGFGGGFGGFGGDGGVGAGGGNAAGGFGFGGW